MSMFEKLEAKLVGIAPLLMHNGQLANPRNKWAKAHKEISSKKKKTDTDHEEMARLEWYGSLYVNDEGAPCLPGEVIEAWVREGAKKSRLGKQVRAAVFCDADSFPLIYKGSKNPDDLYEKPGFRDLRVVRVTSNRVMRCRPIFRDWSAEISVAYNPDMITRAQVVKSMEDAGTWGLCDYRPRFGRCTVEVAQ